MLKYLALVPLSLVVFATGAPAADVGCGDAAVTPATLSVQEANELLHEVGQVKSVTQSPVKGLWLVELEKDGRKGRAFLDYEKKNLIVGTVFPLSSTKGPGDVAAGKARAGKLDQASIPLTGAIVLGNPKGTEKLIVFTDPDCPYCGNLHGELKKLVSLDPDLSVYLKLLPLPMHPQAFTKARVIVGTGSLEMLEKAYRGESLPLPGPNDFREPVAETVALARSIGINGTPALVLPDGEIVTGTMDISSLKNLLSLHKKQ